MQTVKKETEGGQKMTMMVEATDVKIVEKPISRILPCIHTSKPSTTYRELDLEKVEGDQRKTLELL
jgi:hypothetical protein